MGLQAIVLYCANLTHSRTFYEGLGLVFVEERHKGGPKHLSARIGEGIVLELYPESSVDTAGTCCLVFEGEQELRLRDMDLRRVLVLPKVSG